MPGEYEEDGDGRIPEIGDTVGSQFPEFELRHARQERRDMGSHPSS